MGAALASAAVALGHEVIVVSGPVHVAYPRQARIVPVVSTEEMLETCCREFPSCDGLIAAAAPCDYRPQQIASQKIAKTGEPLLLQLIETPDIVATLGAQKRPAQWLVGFALETNDQHIRAMIKLEKKSCDLMVVNGPKAIDAESNFVEIMDRAGRIITTFAGSKQKVAKDILELIQIRLIEQSTT
jgi:phosphopantothenoylcysteine decarboxylase/phosphopantothenate--cysteine ligase